MNENQNKSINNGNLQNSQNSEVNSQTQNNQNNQQVQESNNTNPQSQNIQQNPQPGQANKQINQVPIQQNAQINPQGNTNYVPAWQQNKQVQPNANSQRRPQRNQTLNKNNKSKKISRGGFLIGCFGIGSILLILFITLMILMISQGGETNALLDLFGAKKSQLKSFLLGMINLIFGLISLISIIILVIGIFRRMLAFQDKIEKGKAIKMILFGSIILMFGMSIWIFLYYYIGKIEVEQTIEKREEVVITDPEDTVNLSAPIDVTFTAEPPLENIQQYAWDFDGDGKLDGNGKTVIWRFKDKGKDNTGRFNVKLFVTYLDEKNEEANKEYEHFVFIANEKTNAIFEATPESGSSPLEVFFNATESSDPDGEILAFRWDLDGDGKFDAEGRTLTHTFERSGKYDVTLQVEDNNQETAEYTRTILVDSDAGQKPSAEFQISPGVSGTIPFEIKLDASDSTSRNGKIEKYEWDFSDDSLKDRSRTTTHVYEKAGRYELKLKVTDSTGATDEKIVLVNAMPHSKAPVAKITTDPAYDLESKTLNVVVPQEVMLDASKSTDPDDNIVEYIWDTDGDETEDETGMNVKYTFREEGEYNLILTIIDADDNKSTDKILVKAKKDEYEAKISMDKFSGPVPLRVNFNGTVSRTPKDDPIITYEWSFGDEGSKSPSIFSEGIITHEFNSVGEFKVSLTIHTKSGKTFTTEDKVIVRDVAILAKFEASEEIGKAPLVVSFNPTASTGPIVEYFWDFGDGGSSDEIRPVHTFKKPGVYKVALTVKDAKNNVSIAEESIVVQSETEEE